MQGVAAGVVAKLLRKGNGQSLRGDLGGQVLHARHVEPRQWQDGATFVGPEPRQALGKPVDLVLPDRDHAQHAIRLEASEGEEQGEQRWPVRLLSVVDDDGDRAPILHVAEQLDERRSGGDGIGIACRGPAEGGQLPGQPLLLSTYCRSYGGRPAWPPTATAPGDRGATSIR